MDNRSNTSNASHTLSSLNASCHCTSVSLPIHLPPNLKDQKFPLQVPLCHCSTCRHSTGLLCTSYIPIAAPPVSVLANTTAYPATASSTSRVHRYFCSTCGCHVFRSSLVAGDPERRDGLRDTETNEEWRWEVSTGVLSDVFDVVRLSHHQNIQDTVDGGLSTFITEQNYRSLPDPLDAALPRDQRSESEIKDGDRSISVPELPSKTDSLLPEKNTESNVLQAYCACRTVEFHISRPDATSLLPHSPFPDLMIPYHTHDPLIPNPHDEKWWLRSPAISVPSAVEAGAAEEVQTDQNITPLLNPPSLEAAKYLAGTCACRSCRLTSGFEIQTWAFIPRTNIYFHLPATVQAEPSSPAPPPQPHEPTTAATATTFPPSKTITPLSFPTLRSRRANTNNLPAGSSDAGPVLTAYESSPGVQREFCARCGATVFWHDRWRPEIIDVSVGLLDAAEGARAQGWLEWWCGRVSFGEEARREARGGIWFRRWGGGWGGGRRRGRGRMVGMRGWGGGGEM